MSRLWEQNTPSESTDPDLGTDQFSAHYRDPLQGLLRHRLAVPLAQVLKDGKKIDAPARGPRLPGFVISPDL